MRAVACLFCALQLAPGLQFLFLDGIDLISLSEASGGKCLHLRMPRHACQISLFEQGAAIALHFMRACWVMAVRGFAMKTRLKTVGLKIRASEMGIGARPLHVSNGFGVLLQALAMPSGGAGGVYNDGMRVFRVAARHGR